MMSSISNKYNHTEYDNSGIGKFFNFSLATVIFCSGTAFATESEKTTEEIEALNHQIKELVEEIESDNLERSQLLYIFKQSEKKLLDIQEDINIKNISIKKAEKDIEQNRADSIQISLKQNALIDKVGKSFLYLWKNRQQSNLQALLSTNDQTKIYRNLLFSRYVISHQFKIINDYRSGLTKLATSRKNLEKSRKLLSLRRAALKETQVLLAKTTKIRSSAIEKLGQAIQDRQTQIKILKEDRARLKLLFDQMPKLDLLTRKNSFKSVKGKMPWPTDGIKGNYFGKPRNEGKMHWQGVTILATEGKAVSAIHYGRIAYSNWFQGMGLLIIIDHGEGFMSLYAHNGSLLKNVGDWVTPGTKIATVGRINSSEESSIYFEIRRDGRPTDPALWCAN